MLRLVLLVFALVLFVIDALVPVAIERLPFRLTPAGLACLAASFLFGGH